MSTSTVRILFTGDSAGAVRSVKNLERGFTGLHAAGTAVAGMLTVGIVGGLAAATKAAVDFDRSMRNVNSIAHLSEQQFKGLQKQVLALSKTTGKGPKDLADGLYDIVSSGFKARDAIKVLNASAKAATAGMTDTATATKAVAAILNAYKLKAGEARKVSDVLFQEVNLGVNTFEELAQNIGDTAPQAAALKIPFSEVAAALATITLHGTSMAEASTQVGRVLTAMVKPTDSLTTEFKKMGFENGQAAIEAKGFSGVIKQLSVDAGGNQQKLADWLGDIRGIRGVINLTGSNLDSFTQNLRKMGDATKGVGATQRAFAEQSKSVSFQWQRAKASLTAAAIPLGNLMLPLLTRGATAVGEFADRLQQRMPEIQARFDSLAGGVRQFASALGQVGSNQAGQSVIVGIIAAFAGASVVGKVQDVAAGISKIGIASTTAVGMIGVLAGGLFYLATAADKNALALENLRRAMSGAADSGRDLTQARLQQKQAATAVETAELALERAHKNAADAARRSGRSSLEYREAANAVKLAEEALTQAKQNARTATQDVQKAELKRRDAIRAAAAAMDEAEKAAQREILKARESEYSSTKDALAKKGVVKALDAYATAIHNAEQAAGRAKGPTDAYKTAVKQLVAALGELPPVKDVQIRVAINKKYGIGSDGVFGVDPVKGTTGGSSKKRAVGGFIPMVPGAVSGTDSVHAMLTPGEMVLNRAQQDALGGPRYLASLFGFTGDRGAPARFAKGGIAGKGAGSRTFYRPIRKRPYRKTNAAAREALAAVANVNQREQNLDRAYGQLQRQYSLSDEQLIVTTTNPDGSTTDSVDQAAVAKHLNEVDSLMASRREMLALIEQEKRELKVAIEKLKAAIKRLLDEIKRENDAARADAERVKDLTKQIASNDAAQSKARSGKKTKARDAEVAALEKEGKRLSAARDAAEKSGRGHSDTARNLGDMVGQFRGSLADARDNLANNLPFDRRDVQLDLMELGIERKATAGTSVAPQTSSTASGGGDTGSGTSTTGGHVGHDQSAYIQSLQDKIARLQFGYAVQSAQMPFVGQFARGTVHVPQTGMALVHAGEEIIPAGKVSSMGDGGGNVKVTLQFANGLDALSSFIDARVEGSTDVIMERIGGEADRRRRGGAF